MISDYLRRLGLDRERPSPDYLQALHQAQVERVPYENLEIMLGKPTTIDPMDSIRRIVKGRGGYCYHLNGAFAALLADLGFAVSRHVGGVSSLTSSRVGANGNHLALTVSGLPGTGCPEGAWFVDCGLGDALYQPVPLRAHEVVQGPFRYRLDPSTVVEGGWYLTHDEGGSFQGMDFGPIVPDMTYFIRHHEDLSGADGHFTRMLVAGRRDAGGVDLLRDATLLRWDANGKVSLQLTGADEWRAVWGDIFGIKLNDDEVARLWPHARERTERWLVEQSTEAR